MNNHKQEFDRQAQNLIDKDYPSAAKITRDDLRKLLEPLREHLSKIENIKIDPANGEVPFVIVVKSDLVSSEKAMFLSGWNDKQAITKLNPLTPPDFLCIDSVDIPEKDIYLLCEISRGSEYLNVRPQDVLKEIQKKNFSPLTIDEGIALITQFPQFLKRNNCFSLLASRKKNDKRVPAIWINSKDEANLGWCWDGNPHAWLGSSYARFRA